MATSATAAATPNAIDTARSRVSDTRRTTGRAMLIRRMNSPIAAITNTNAMPRAVIRLGVAAVSDVDGTGNCGNGPGFGPTANVNTPRTGCPSTEMTRQYTRYQPGATRSSGTTRVFGSAA